MKRGREDPFPRLVLEQAGGGVSRERVPSACCPPNSSEKREKSSRGGSQRNARVSRARAHSTPRAGATVLSKIMVKRNSEMPSQRKLSRRPFFWNGFT